MKESPHCKYLLLNVTRRISKPSISSKVSYSLIVDACRAQVPSFYLLFILSYSVAMFQDGTLSCNLSPTYFKSSNLELQCEVASIFQMSTQNNKTLMASSPKVSSKPSRPSIDALRIAALTPLPESESASPIHTKRISNTAGPNLNHHVVPNVTTLDFPTSDANGTAFQHYDLLRCPGELAS